MTATRTAAQLLVDCLVKHEVKYIFGIPGAKIDAVFDALLDSPIKVVVCRHEQNAAFMAGAYGRLTGKPGVVLVTSGPGVSNLATGLLTATTEGDPIIAIGGAVARNMRLKQSHQSTDNIKLMEAVTKARMEATVVENIPEIVENAFRIASAPRSGAVFISLPQDLLKQETTATTYPATPNTKQGAAAPDLITQAATLINKAKRPVILLGMEASRPANTQAMRELLSQHPIATVSTYQAAGVISRDLVHCFAGRVGLFKNQPGDRLLDAADVVITIGFNPVEYDPEIWNASGTRTIIHLDYQAADIHSTYLPQCELLGDITATILALSKTLALTSQLADDTLVKSLRQELATLIDTGKQHTEALMHPLRFINELRQFADDDNTVVVSDIGSHYMWLARYFLSYEPHHLLFSNGQQTLGVALPWAMAAKFVYPQKKIISISGDGGFLFSSNELETAVREKLPLVHCVWCDGSYNMVKEQQLMKYKRDSAVQFGAVDLVKYAESFGAYGFRIKHADEFASLLKHAFTLDKPVIIEIPIDYRDNPALFKAADARKMN
jgi:acetolactate synthase-1/2/3 large subunit